VDRGTFESGADAVMTTVRKWSEISQKSYHCVLLMKSKKDQMDGTLSMDVNCEKSIQKPHTEGMRVDWRIILKGFLQK
jgi:hypothetical protein